MSAITCRNSLLSIALLWSSLSVAAVNGNDLSSLLAAETSQLPNVSYEFLVGIRTHRGESRIHWGCFVRSLGGREFFDKLINRRSYSIPPLCISSRHLATRPILIEALMDLESQRGFCAVSFINQVRDWADINLRNLPDGVTIEVFQGYVKYDGSLGLFAQRIGVWATARVSMNGHFLGVVDLLHTNQKRRTRQHLAKRAANNDSTCESLPLIPNFKELLDQQLSTYNEVVEAIK